MVLPSNPKPFVCEGCSEIISKPHHFSKNPKLCDLCYLEKKALDENRCINCGGKNPRKEYWGQCEKCFNSPINEEDLKESEEIERIEREEGWEAAEEYSEKKS